MYFQNMHNQWAVPVDNFFVVIIGFEFDSSLLPQLDIRNHLFVSTIFSVIFFVARLKCHICQGTEVIVGFLLLIFVINVVIISHIPHLQNHQQKE